MELSVPLSRFASRVGGGSAFFVRHHYVFMKPSHIFGIIVRTFGLCAFLYSVWKLVFGLFAVIWDFCSQRSPTEETAVYFIYGIPTLIGGVLLMRFGDYIVRFCYPDNKE